MAERLADITASGEAVVLLGGRPGRAPVGIAVLRFRPALWSAGQESYLAELFVAPAERGRGLGRHILTAALRLARERGADSMDLGTSEDDVAARALYESLGFVNRERPRRADHLLLRAGADVGPAARTRSAAPSG